MTLKVVNLGLPKTGTTTLARALRRAGLHVADHRVRPHQTDDEDVKYAFVADLIYRGLYGEGDPGAYFKRFDAISEMSLLRQGRSVWPQMDFAVIDGLRQHHPGIQFLASSRDPFEISQSMLAWSDFGVSRLPSSVIPGLPEGYGETSKERIQWIEGHYAHLDAIFAGSDDYLRFDIADPGAQEQISTFLDIPLPWWGKANVNPMNATG